MKDRCKCNKVNSSLIPIHWFTETRIPILCISPSYTLLGAGNRFSAWRPGRYNCKRSASIWFFWGVYNGVWRLQLLIPGVKFLQCNFYWHLASFWQSFCRVQQFNWWRSIITYQNDLNSSKHTIVKVLGNATFPQCLLTDLWVFDVNVTIVI